MPIISLALILMFAYPHVLTTTTQTTQNCDALNLPTTSLTDTQVRAKANAVWGQNSIVRWEWDGDRNYSIKEVGRHVEFLDYDFGFSPTPRTRRDKQILGTDDRGSWRRAWNNAMIAWCRAGGTVVP